MNQDHISLKIDQFNKDIEAARVEARRLGVEVGKAWAMLTSKQVDAFSESEYLKLSKGYADAVDAEDKAIDEMRKMEDACHSFLANLKGKG